MATMYFCLRSSIEKMKSETTNIIIAEDHEIFREGLKMVLGKMKELNIVAEVSDGFELLEVLKKINTHIILLDIEICGTQGFESIKKIQKTYPDIKIIVLTMFNDNEVLSKIAKTGVHCFLPKNSEKKIIKRAIHLVIEGKLFFPLHFNEYSNNLNFTAMKTTKILIVDDDIDVITVIETILSKKGYEVITAMNKEEGMKKIREENPDLAILDVMMTTHYEGFELAKEITEDPELKNMPVLMQTSIEVLITTRPDVQEMAREFRKNPGFKDLHVLLVKDIITGKAGIDYLSEKGKTVWFPVDGFVAKPVDPGKILPEIEKVLTARKN